MNKWGVVGCITHRDKIIKWFAKKGSACGMDVTPASIRSLLRAGLKAWQGAR